MSGILSSCGPRFESQAQYLNCFNLVIKSILNSFFVLWKGQNKPKKRPGWPIKKNWVRNASQLSQLYGCYKIENVFCKRLRTGERTRPDNPFTKGPISKMKTTIILIKIGLDFIDLLQGCRGPINPAPVAINSLPKNDHFKTRNRVFASWCVLAVIAYCFRRIKKYFLMSKAAAVGALYFAAVPLHNNQK